jgi:hypothetical protein
LSDSFEELNNKYDAMDGLTKGTEEWNKAVQDVNSSVLGLIEKYPELAGLVENDNGVLKLDVDSSEAQAVLKEYKKDEVAAQGAALGAKANLSRAQTEYDLDKMDREMFEKFEVEKVDGVGMAIGNLAAATTAGAVSGALIGGGLGMIGGPFAAVTAGAGALVGGIAGFLGGIATFEETMDRTEKKSEANRENIKELA